MADAPGDAIVVSPECRKIDQGTLDNIRMWRVNPRSELKVCCEPSHRMIFDEGVFAFDLCPPGMKCKLNCPWLSPFLFVPLGKCFFTSREQPVLADIRGCCWEPGGTHSTVGFPQEYTPVMCRDFTPEFNRELINRPSDLVNRFGLLCVFSGDTVSSLCVPPVLFDRALSQPVLSDLGILVAQVFTLMCLERFYIREVSAGRTALSVR